MLIIVSEANGKHLIENRYPNKGPKGMKLVYGWERDPKASYSVLVCISGHANAAEFAKKISKKVGPCQAAMSALGGDPTVNA
ncbi:hypothetical protein LCGC14_0985880 [marine sediment metagenome]|uniref:Uncharacterized protein n=1 Tax=marine sediment metagenome TaxID=412755 RepID=A0A0F9RDY3_9ZZZZ